MLTLAFIVTHLLVGLIPCWFVYKVSKYQAKNYWEYKNGKLDECDFVFVFLAWISGYLGLLFLILFVLVNKILSAALEFGKRADSFFEKFLEEPLDD